MSLRTKLRQMCMNPKQDTKEFYEKYKKFKIPSLPIIREKVSQHSKTCLSVIVILFLIFIYFIQQVPHWQVSQFNITNPTEVAKLENSYRATLAQILGGFAIGFGLYYTWRRITIAEKELKVTQRTLGVAQKNLKATQRIAEDNRKVAQESQITERFTRAVNQLGAIDRAGNLAIEIRLGGIYALERIANESEKDYWPIMEILTAYVRKNSSVDSQLKEKHIAIKAISVDIQADENINNKHLKVQKMPLDIQTILTIIGKRQSFFWHGEIKTLNLSGANLSGANLSDANLFNANLSRTNLKRTKNLTIGQLSKVKTLYDAILDEELEKSLKGMHPTLFEKPK